MSNSRVCAILLAGGSGSRMNLKISKQRLLIKGKSVLFRAMLAFESCKDITDIILVAREEDLEFAKKETEGLFLKLRKIVVGGKNRVESARNGFFAIDFPADYVAVHDVARCLIRSEMISKIIFDAKKYGAASASSRVVDTVKRVNSDGFIIATEKREELRLAGTPQIFRYDMYKNVILNVDVDDPGITDDNILFERIGVPVYLTEVGTGNIKITHAEDLPLAEYLLGEENV